MKSLRFVSLFSVRKCSQAGGEPLKSSVDKEDTMFQYALLIESHRSQIAASRSRSGVASHNYSTGPRTNPDHALQLRRRSRWGIPER